MLTSLSLSSFSSFFLIDSSFIRIIRHRLFRNSTSYSAASTDTVYDYFATFDTGNDDGSFRSFDMDPCVVALASTPTLLISLAAAHPFTLPLCQRTHTNNADCLALRRLVLRSRLSPTLYALSMALRIGTPLNHFGGTSRAALLCLAKSRLQIWLLGVWEIRLVQTTHSHSTPAHERAVCDMLSSCYHTSVCCLSQPKTCCLRLAACGLRLMLMTTAETLFLIF